MSCRHLAAFVTVVAIAYLGPIPAAGQGEADDEATWTAPRLPDGRPDLQGYWTTQTFTPLERPDYLAGKEFFTEEEAAALQQQFAAEGVDPVARSAINLEEPEAREQRLRQTKENIHYDNAIWLGTSVPKGLSSRRTSLITDPPNGRIPPLTPKGAAQVAADQLRRAERLTHFDSYETRPLMERCIVWTHEGPPIFPPAYNDIHQIFQTPDYVVIFTELAANSPRIVPLDGRPPLPDKIRQFVGDSRGHWEGDTLVVESTNFVERRSYRGSTKFRHVVERFTRVAPDMIRYEFTIDDPTVWMSSWSGEVPMLRTEGPMFEYGCHEGNHDIRHILEIHRNLDRQEATAAEAEQESK